MGEWQKCKRFHGASMHPRSREICILLWLASFIRYLLLRENGCSRDILRSRRRMCFRKPSMQCDRRIYSARKVELVLHCAPNAISLTVPGMSGPLRVTRGRYKVCSR